MNIMKEPNEFATIFHFALRIFRFGKLLNQ